MWLCRCREEKSLKIDESLLIYLWNLSTPDQTDTIERLRERTKDRRTKWIKYFDSRISFSFFVVNFKELEKYIDLVFSNFFHKLGRVENTLLSGSGADMPMLTPFTHHHLISHKVQYLISFVITIWTIDTKKHTPVVEINNQTKMCSIA